MYFKMVPWQQKSKDITDFSAQSLWRLVMFLLITRLPFSWLSPAPDLKWDIPVVIRELLDNCLHWPLGTGVKLELSVVVTRAGWQPQTRLEASTFLVGTVVALLLEARTTKAF